MKSQKTGSKLESFLEDLTEIISGSFVFGAIVVSIYSVVLDKPEHLDMATKIAIVGASSHYVNKTLK